MVTLDDIIEEMKGRDFKRRETELPHFVFPSEEIKQKYLQALEHWCDNGVDYKK